MLFSLTVTSGDVAATLTDYPAYVDLSQMPAGFWSVVANGGGDIRVYSDEAKTTELAREVVSCDTATDTGELHVKIPSLTTSTVIYIDVDGARSDYAVTDTYGRNAVWSDYAFVLHLQTYASPYVNSTGATGATPTSLSSANDIAGQLGGGLNMPSSGDYLTQPSAALNEFTLQSIFKRANATMTDSSSAILDRSTSLGNYTRWQGLRVNATTGYAVLGSRNGTPAQNVELTSNVSVCTGSRVLIHATLQSGAQAIYIDGVSNVTGSTTHGANSLATSFFVNRTYNVSPGYLSSADYDEIRVRTSALSANWITTEKNNLMDVAGFWTIAEVEEDAPVNSGFFSFM